MLDALNDLVLYGGAQFTAHVLNLDSKVQQKNAIELVSLQFVSLKDFVEKFNTILKEFLQINTGCQELGELMHELSRVMPFIFSAEKVLLWAADAVNRVLGSSAYQVREAARDILLLR